MSSAARSLVVEVEGQRFVATGGNPFLIGRDPASAIVASDESVSRRHAQLRFEDGAWVYEDLGSTNGSYVDGSRVVRVSVGQGLSVRIGDPQGGELVRMTPSTMPDRAVATWGRSLLLSTALGAVLLLLAGVLLLVGAPGAQTLITPIIAPAATSTVTPTAASLTRSDVVAIGKAATVRIDTGAGTGSGVYLGSDQILTAYHVAADARVIAVSFDNQWVGTARVVRVDKSDDLALLTMPGLEAVGARAVAWGDSDRLGQGEDLLAFGYAAGEPLSVKVGVVSRLYTEGDTKFVQTDASVNPGMSGGPILNERGQLVGVNDKVATAPGYAGLSFAVASATAREFVEGLR